MIYTTGLGKVTSNCQLQIAQYLQQYRHKQKVKAVFTAVSLILYSDLNLVCHM